MLDEMALKTHRLTTTNVPVTPERHRKWHIPQGAGLFVTATLSRSQGELQLRQFQLLKHQSHWWSAPLSATPDLQQKAAAAGVINLSVAERSHNADRSYSLLKSSAVYTLAVWTSNAVEPLPAAVAYRSDLWARFILMNSRTARGRH